MRKLRRLAGSLALAGTVLAVGAGSAAADNYHRWSGFYLGVHIGGTWADYRLSGDVGAFDENVLERYSLDPANVSFGGHIGINHQFGMVVVGLEADFTFAGANDRIVQFASPDNHIEARLGSHGSLVARLGWAGGRFMPYVRGGFAWGQFSTLAGDLVDGTFNLDATDATSRSDTLTGWTVGGGLEYALTKNWILRAEYNYMDFGTFTTTNLDNDRFGHDLIVHNARVGISYKIGRDHHDPLK